MKKCLDIFAAAALAFGFAFSFTACGDDDKKIDDPDIPGLTDSTPVSADLTTYAWFSKDMVDNLNIDVTYVDADGITQKAVVGSVPVTVNYIGENYTLYPVKASVSATRFPAKLDMKIRYTKKTGVTADPSQVYKFVFVSQNEAYVTYKDGQKVGMKNPILDGYSLSFKGDKFDQAVDRFRDKADDVDVEVERNGKIDF